ncbi:exocyst complex component 8-like [Copidosoma floridanum]|uniref:exocyst complex component 8-like n=1 Tax=Copidosoma floridanum TaxID=29053 RepID=UPI0006C9DC7E|nr:exocyst complex component 8-like [Copidosoma floridanum]
MSQSLTKLFVSINFNPERYVKDISCQCIGADELRQQKAKIQDLLSFTSKLLKKNVYQNYKQFIETAKEISHLESEMYQLCQLLSEQRSLLNSLNCDGSKGIVLDDLNTEQKNLLDSQSLKATQSELAQVLENIEGSTYR